MKYTFNRLIEFNEKAKEFYRTVRTESAFSNAIDDAVERIRPHFEGKDGYNYRANRINRSTAAKDEKHKGILLTDNNGRFLYTSAGLQRRDDEMNALGEEEIELEFEYCDEVPEMNLEMQKIFKGIVINPIKKEVATLEVVQ
ncbi:MAG: hypothetical protein WCJ33_01510 [Pseudomonadota bacterium]